MAMMSLRDKLAAAERPRLLRYIARAIHGFTIMARDPDETGHARAAINNCIHYLAGHLIGLADPMAPLEDTQLDGILEQIARLNRRLAEEIEADLSR